MFSRLGAIVSATFIYVLLLTPFIRSLPVALRQQEVYLFSRTVTIAIVTACIVIAIYTFLLLPFVEMITKYARNSSEEWLLYNLFAFAITLFGVLYIYIVENHLLSVFSIILIDFILFIGIALYVVMFKVLGGARWKNEH